MSSDKNDDVINYHFLSRGMSGVTFTFKLCVNVEIPGGYTHPSPSCFEYNENQAAWKLEQKFLNSPWMEKGLQVDNINKSRI